MTAPKLRLAGFKEPWNSGVVSRLLVERKELAPQSKQYPLMAFVAYKGVASKGDRYDRSSLVKDVAGKLYKRTEKGDFIYSSNNLETGSIGLNKYGKACISPVYGIFCPTCDSDSEYIGVALCRKKFIQEMVKWRQGVVYGQWRIHEDDFLGIPVPFPDGDEQRAMGCYFASLDRLIDAEVLRLESLRKLKVACLEKMFVRNGERVPGLRLAGFAEDWHVTKVGDLLDYEQPQKYIVANRDYQKTGTPVLTAGKTFILGYSQEKNGVCTDVPVIIFDDFVTCSKYVNFRFKVKSSAVKILRLKDKSNSLFFVYMLMQHLGYRARYHQRHWISEYSQMSVKVPAPEEQVAISNFFMTIDQSISSVEGRIKGFRRLRRACIERMFV